MVVAAAAIAPFATTRFELASPPTGEHFRFATSSRSADGLFRFVWTLAAGKRGPGEHFHQDETETFEVVSGVLRIWIGGVPRDLHPGDRVAVPPRVPHRFLNPGPAPAIVNVTLDGPRMEDTFVPCAVAQDAKPSGYNMLRFMVTTGVSGASTPNNQLFVWIMAPFVWLPRLFGVRPFEPVTGWDRA